MAVRINDSRSRFYLSELNIEMPYITGKSESRSKADLQYHYDIEKKLASELRQASKVDRQKLYSQVYDELYRLVPSLIEGIDSTNVQELVALKLQVLLPFLSRESTFLEIGAGDCELALEVAGITEKVYAVDASTEAVGKLDIPENFNLIVSDSIELPFDNASIDVAYSCHFIEHLHPDDAYQHVTEIYRVLRSGGVYQCITPNRLWGPHDISRYFDDIPTGLHLCEYTHRELAGLFRQAGFHNSKVLRGIGIGREPQQSPLWPYSILERTLGLFPVTLRRHIMNLFLRGLKQPFRPLEQVILVMRR